jgi:hypothetical protein
MHILIDYKYYAHIIQSGKRESTLYLGRAMGTELIPKTNEPESSINMRAQHAT